MKHNMTKRMFSMVLALVMVIGLIPISTLTVFAQSEITIPTIVSIGIYDVDQETNMGGTPTALIGKPYSTQVVATGGNLTYSAGSSGYMSLPDGLSINAKTGVISGTCTETEIGRHNVYISVSNAMGEAHAVVGMWVVDDSIAPVIETEEGQLGEAVYVNSFAYFKVSVANNADILNDLQWSIKEGSLPNGMSLTYTKTKTVYIQGKPTQAGTFNFTLKAENEIGSAERAFSIVVKEGTEKPRIIDYNELPYAITGKPYEYQLRATGTNTQSDSIVWSYNDTEYSQASYDLGNGLTLSKTGLISGTPIESKYLSFSYIYAKNTAGYDKKEAYIIIHGNGEVSSIVVSPAQTVVKKGGSFQFTAEVFGYGDVSQTIDNWDESMWYEPIGSWFPRPTSDDTKVENGLLTVGEDEEREQIMVVAIAGSEKGYAMVTIAEKGAEIFTVSFNANGGTGDMNNIPVVKNDTCSLPACDFTAPEGYKFKAWAIGGVNGEQKQPGAQIVITGDTCIFAVWEALPHTCSNPQKQTGKSATCTAAGWKDYYKCTCGKLYADANCATEITNLEGWKIGDGQITIKSHSYNKVTTKATLTKNGSIKKVCNVCDYASSSVTTIYKISSITLSKTSYTYNGKVQKPTVTVKDSKGNTIPSSNYTVTYDSGCKSAGTYKVKVTMKGNYSGTKTLSYKINPIDISKCTLSLSTTSYTYNGKVKTPSVTVKTSNGTKLTKDTHYTVSYASGRKNVGSFKVTIKGKGNYSGTKTLTFKINPAKTTISKLTAGSKKLTVNITKKSTQVTGYQIKYSTSKSFSNAKTKTISSYKTTKYTLTGLSAKKTYYVKVRTYKTVNGVKYYSGWSEYKSAKTK